MFPCWPFTTIKICPIAYKVAQVGLKVYQIPNKTFFKWPKNSKIWPKYRNFAKYGHTVHKRSDLPFPGNGYIPISALKEILHELDPKLTETELDGIIEEIDEYGSGTVDFDGKIVFKFDRK